MKKIVNIVVVIMMFITQFIPTNQVVAIGTEQNGGMITKTSTIKRNIESYWSTSNAPIFYGATKITIRKGMLSEFNPKDARFRIFAKDFEDGDLTSNITYTGTVDVNTVGTYDIMYQVSDSHGNISTLTVPVIITDNENAKINVERTLYTIPSVWNMDLAGFSRCNYGDRQILGIYMPANSSVRARILSASKNITVNFLANDSAIESGVTLNTNGEWVNLSNVKNGESYDSVPLFTTSVMDRGVALDTVFTIELEYDDTVKELDYYHQNDDEEVFRSKWKASGNTYSIIENEVITVVVPITDIEKLTNYYRNSFSSLDQFLEYWQKVVDRMDELVGLNLNPVELTDQNVRTKYLVKANIHGAGAAYYSGNHVGLNSSSVAPFFEMNWGGLHEFAHGYQGTLGKGNMSLGEVSNNILGHYIQMDKSIYFHSGDWLGEMSQIEESKNQGRLEGKAFVEVDVSTRLYALINLFDSIDGANTYTNIFKWYRFNLSQNNIENVANNQDSYVRALAEIYHINVIPYMEDWGLVIADPVKDEIYSKNYPMVSILKDTVGSDKLNIVLQGENQNRKYGLITNEVLSKYNINGNLKIEVDIDDIDKIKGKVIQIKSGNQVIQSTKIDNTILEDNVITVSDVPVGTYYVQMPVVTDYTQGHMYVQIQNGEGNSYTYSYQKIGESEYNNYIYFRVHGYLYDTIGFQLNFSDNYKKATITYPAQSAMSGNEYVRIYDTGNNLIFDDTVANSPSGKNFNYGSGTQIIALQPGYVIEICYPNKYANKIRFYSNLRNEILPEYSATSTITRYIVMDKGIRKEEMTEEQASNLAYENMRPTLVNTIETYQSKVTNEELNNKTINFKEKQDVINAYNNLREVDQIPYRTLIMKIKRGGVPRVSSIGQLEYKIDAIIDLYSFIVATDNEDGIIPINEDSTHIETNLDIKKVGTYDVTYKVSDSDGNITSHTLKITIKGSEENMQTDVEKPVEDSKNESAEKPIEEDSKNESAEKPIEEDSKNESAEKPIEEDSKNESAEKPVEDSKDKLVETSIGDMQDETANPPADNPSSDSYVHLVESLKENIQNEYTGNIVNDIKSSINEGSKDSINQETSQGTIETSTGDNMKIDQQQNSSVSNDIKDDDQTESLTKEEILFEFEQREKKVNLIAWIGIVVTVFLILWISLKFGYKHN